MEGMNCGMVQPSVEDKSMVLLATLKNRVFDLEKELEITRARVCELEQAIRDTTALALHEPEPDCGKPSRSPSYR
jgi:hypothetical protein